MDRLTFVRDVCHIGQSPFSAWRSSVWHRNGLPPTQTLTNGFSDRVFHARFFTWYRHYTVNGMAPDCNAVKEHPEYRRSLISLHEWVPGIWPLASEIVGWKRMGILSHHGIAYLPEDPQADITASWSSHAKRHVKTFFAHGCSITMGTMDDVRADMLRSQVPRAMSLALAKICDARMRLDPETMEIFVARNAQGERIGCFVAANDEETKESMYLMGYFLPEAAKLQPMAGLVFTWLSGLHARGYRAGNFGLMVGPHTSRLDPWWGLSYFKTHFGITRVHLPQSLWRFIWRS